MCNLLTQEKKLMILGNKEISRKCPKRFELKAQLEA